MKNGKKLNGANVNGKSVNGKAINSQKVYIEKEYKLTEEDLILLDKISFQEETTALDIIIIYTGVQSLSRVEVFGFERLLKNLGLKPRRTRREPLGEVIMIWVGLNYFEKVVEKASPMVLQD